ncbi:serine protease [Aliiglaciecola sp. M165]|uniref:S1 family peptidase n=1 Tax=Aliiglaciecola sp. M165 TaxID=2593649 RepID=UPI00117D1A76|nr:serine protease [Aliiglaciecola sp. M165]TRY32373.1 trypsin-like peptidase domain-containing protein [Aliiglaciecola sp. M165]
MRSFLFIVTVFFSQTAFSQQTAQNLFNQYRPALYQIQMIDKESGNKSSIGSGFLVNGIGDMVSNYHVISDYVYFPDKYRIQYLDSNGNTGDLTLQTFDVINDLSLLKIDQQGLSHTSLQIANALPLQGSTIFSLGNPHDLGMIVVPGTFNGLKKNSFYQRIHFTGSINPGMSGGPAVNENGQVVGVNVATAGNQIGFLIPLPKVANLLAAKQTLEPTQYKAHIQQQLHDNQKAMIEKLLSSNWQTGMLGKASIPEQISDFITCWGGSNASEKNVSFLSVSNRCRIGESIFLNGKLQTGEVEIEFEWLTTEKLNSVQFHNLISQKIAFTRPGNPATKNDVTNYRCQQDLVQNARGMTQKSVLCARAYKDFEDLFDVLYISASNDFNQGSLISHFTLSGVSNESMEAFSKHFMDSMSWQ